MNMEKIREVLRLSEKGISKREIERALNVSRPVITEYQELFKRNQLTYIQIQNLTDEVLSEILFPEASNIPEKKKRILSLFPEYVKELTRPGVTLQLLWEEYRSKDNDAYSYSQFCFHYQMWKEQLEICMHQEMKSGDKLFVDYTGNKLRVMDKVTGQEKEVEVFVGILGASQLIYAEASFYQKQEDVIRSTENCLHYYGGVPKAIVPDCMKTAVIKANKYEPEINPLYADFAKHYDTVIFPTRPASPRDKSLVENAVRIVYRRIFAPLRNQIFYSIEELNLCIRQELEKLNDAPMQKLKLSRRQLFEQVEKSELAALPNRKYMLRKITTATVGINYHVYLAEDKRYYSVPYTLRGNKISLFYTDTAVEMVYKNERVAIHERNRNHGYSTNKEHMPSQHKFYSEWNPERIQAMADNVGGFVKNIVIKIMDQSKYPEQGFKSCIGIIQLSKKYGNERLNKACRKAIIFQSFQYTFIKNILLNNQEEIEEEPTLFPDLVHENIRGAAYYS
jgi:transposase